ncbi:MAG: DEAD/DEAH box helicase [Cetobacterium sp.]
MTKKSIYYLDKSDPDIIDDIKLRQEFLLLQKDNDNEEFRKSNNAENKYMNIIPRFIIDKMRPESNYLEFLSYQTFVQNFINPNTPYSRLLIKWMTGFGKTIGSISIAMEFISYYRRNQYYEKYTDAIGHIYVIGFSQNIFINELLKYPEFGFVNREEISIIKKLQDLAKSGDKIAADKLMKYRSLFKRRVSNRKGNGYFKFIGYKELANMLFIYTTLNDDKKNITSMTEEEIIENIKNNKLVLNEEKIKEFANSLLICDEIHNVYNTFEKNNWGITLQTILNYHSNLRAVFLSATPMNNSPTEVIDLLNLLLPRSHFQSLKKSDFFTKEGERYNLIKEKEKELYIYLNGRVSYISSKDTDKIASKQFIGETILNIDYLKFIRCTMSQFQYNTYRNADKNNYVKNSHYLADFALPDPTFRQPFDKKSIGIYIPDEIKDKLNTASSAWKNKMGLFYNNDNNSIYGRLLQSKTLPIISHKYAIMLKILLDNVKKKKGKTFIFHNFIHNSGAIFIQEVLKQNNIVSEKDESTSETLCSICLKKKKEHSASQFFKTDNQDNKSHIYKPLRFGIVHSSLDRNNITKTLEKFNHYNNIDGSEMMFLIGTKLLKEGHSMVAVRNVVAASRPDNISTLIQIIGRALRINAHNMLPKKDRNVDIYLLVSTIEKSMRNFPQELSYEEEKYKQKIESFKVIQQIEKIMNDVAIDKHFNYDTIWQRSINNSSAENSIDILYYTNPYNSITVDDINLSTFNVYYAKKTVASVTYIIKRLFIEISPVWTYEDLFKAVTNPPFNVEINTKLISSEIFNISLNMVVYSESQDYEDIMITNMLQELDTNNLMDKLRNPNDQIIFVANEMNYVVVHTGELYSLAFIKDGEIFIDHDSVFRSFVNNKSTYVDITNFLKSESLYEYDSKKVRFISKWKNASLSQLEQSLCDFGMSFHVRLIEDIITYLFNILFTGVQRKRLSDNPLNKKICNATKDKNHNFFIRMLKFYDIYKFIIWGHILNQDTFKEYSDLIMPVNISDKLKKPIDPKYIQKSNSQNKNNDSKENLKEKFKEPLCQNNDINSLLTAIGAQIYSNEIESGYEQNLKTYADYINQKCKDPKHSTKIRADLLAVGHYIGKTPKIYDFHNNTWKEYKIKNKSVKENNIIIGYDERSRTSMSVKFKLRTPKQFRTTETSLDRGAVCLTRTKRELSEIAKKLGVETGKKDNTEKLCGIIRNRLINLELEERCKPNGFKYFYTILEDQE